MFERKCCQYPEALWGRGELLRNWGWENIALYFPRGKRKFGSGNLTLMYC